MINGAAAATAVSIALVVAISSAAATATLLAGRPDHFKDHDRAANDTNVVASTTVGFLNIPNAPLYQYGPTVALVNENYVAMWCSPGVGNGDWDVIRLAISPDLVTWGNAEIILQPQNGYDTNSVCDPSLVLFKNEWFLYHTCINQKTAPDGYPNNRVCVAISDGVLGPFYAVTRPVMQDLSCQNAYCVGQPSAIVSPDGEYVMLYYSKSGPNDNNGPSPGYTYVARSRDGINFETLNDGKPVFPQSDVDVKYDRVSKQFLLVQGNVASKIISYATSHDGVNFTAWDPVYRVIAANPATPGSNGNPGLVGMPDGSFSGMTQVIYGSNIPNGPTTAWQLYMSNAVLAPTMNDCFGCASISCDKACESPNGRTDGFCAVPFSGDPKVCCQCGTYVQPPGCAQCAAGGGCVAACRGAAYTTGICAVPGSTNTSNCCECLH